MHGSLRSSVKNHILYVSGKNACSFWFLFQRQRTKSYQHVENNKVATCCYDAGLLLDTAKLPGIGWSIPWCSNPNFRPVLLNSSEMWHDCFLKLGLEYSSSVFVMGLGCRIWESWFLIQLTSFTIGSQRGQLGKWADLLQLDCDAASRNHPTKSWLDISFDGLEQTNMLAVASAALILFFCCQCLWLWEGWPGIMAEESRIDELSQSESCADDNTIPPTQPDKLQPAPSGMAFLKSKTQQIYVIIKLTQNSMISALLMNDVAPVFFLPVPYSFLRSIAGAPSSTKGTHVTWSGETGTSEAAKAQVQKQPADGQQLPKKPRPNKRPAAAVSQVEAKADTTQEGEVEEPEAGLLPWPFGTCFWKWPTNQPTCDMPFCVVSTYLTMFLQSQQPGAGSAEEEGEGQSEDKGRCATMIMVDFF